MWGGLWQISKIKSRIRNLQHCQIRQTKPKFQRMLRIQRDLQDTTPLYSLHDSFILDSGATVHICNNCHWFEDFVPASDQLYARESQSDIEGCGTVRINLTRPSGQLSIKLVHVTYIPEFQTNTVSYNRLLKKGIHWDKQNRILAFEGKLWC